MEISVRHCCETAILSVFVLLVRYKVTCRYCYVKNISRLIGNSKLSFNAALFEHLRSGVRHDGS
jgi:hypothetical protein